ncbi:hypothetical protein cyc_01916 [Cyclospora cayetanensis]|uniref:Uncharacterized protein n=1 Tax=Cyclospora cayetanensis TaxID=88456 RepID=A0A1D3CSS3_9EIME|nr:hypothetical protein cyc_01916 [Cyclospora cayetanensis]
MEYSLGCWTVPYSSCIAPQNPTLSGDISCMYPAIGGHLLQPSSENSSRELYSGAKETLPFSMGDHCLVPSNCTKEAPAQSSEVSPMYSLGESTKTSPEFLSEHLCCVICGKPASQSKLSNEQLGIERQSVLGDTPSLPSFLVGYARGNSGRGWEWSVPVSGSASSWDSIYHQPSLLEQPQQRPQQDEAPPTFAFCHPEDENSPMEKVELHLNSSREAIHYSLPFVATSQASTVFTCPRAHVANEGAGAVKERSVNQEAHHDGLPLQLIASTEIGCSCRNTDKPTWLTPKMDPSGVTSVLNSSSSRTLGAVEQAVASTTPEAAILSLEASGGPNQRSTSTPDLGTRKESGHAPAERKVISPCFFAAKPLEKVQSSTASGSSSTIDSSDFNRFRRGSPGSIICITKSIDYAEIVRGSKSSDIRLSNSGYSKTAGETVGLLGASASIPTKARQQFGMQRNDEKGRCVPKEESDLGPHILVEDLELMEGAAETLCCLLAKYRGSSQAPLWRTLQLTSTSLHRPMLASKTSQTENFQRQEPEDGDPAAANGGYRPLKGLLWNFQRRLKEEGAFQCSSTQVPSHSDPQRATDAASIRGYNTSSSSSTAPATVKSMSTTSRQSSCGSSASGRSLGAHECPKEQYKSASDPTDGRSSGAWVLPVGHGKGPCDKPLDLAGALHKGPFKDPFISSNWDNSTSSVKTLQKDVGKICQWEPSRACVRSASIGFPDYREGEIVSLPLKPFLSEPNEVIQVEGSVFSRSQCSSSSNPLDSSAALQPTEWSSGQAAASQVDTNQQHAQTSKLRAAPFKHGALAHSQPIDGPILHRLKNVGTLGALPTCNALKTTEHHLGGPKGASVKLQEPSQQGALPRISRPSHTEQVPVKSPSYGRQSGLKKETPDGPPEMRSLQAVAERKQQQHREERERGFLQGLSCGSTGNFPISEAYSPQATKWLLRAPHHLIIEGTSKRNSRGAGHGQPQMFESCSNSTNSARITSERIAGSTYSWVESAGGSTVTSNVGAVQHALQWGLQLGRLVASHSWVFAFPRSEIVTYVMPIDQCDALASLSMPLSAMDRLWTAEFSLAAVTPSVSRTDATTSADAAAGPRQLYKVLKAFRLEWRATRRFVLALEPRGEVRVLGGGKGHHQGAPKEHGASENEAQKRESAGRWALGAIYGLREGQFEVEARTREMFLSVFSITRSAALSVPPARGPPPPKKKATPQQKKTTQVGDVPLHLRRYRPHLPESLVAETTAFLKSSSKLRCLLDLIFSPREGDEQEAERKSLQERLEEYHLLRQRHDAPFVLREAAAAASAFRALGSLPADLHAEAIQSSSCSACRAGMAATPATTAPIAEANAAQQWLQQKAAARGAGQERAPAAASSAEEIEDENKKAEDWDAYRHQEFPEALAFHQMYRQQLMEGLTATEKHKLQVFQNLIHLRFPHADLKKRQPELFWISERHAIGRQKEQALKKKKK